jgi:hypothetical protein
MAHRYNKSLKGSNSNIVLRSAKPKALYSLLRGRASYNRLVVSDAAAGWRHAEQRRVSVSDIHALVLCPDSHSVRLSLTLSASAGSPGLRDYQGCRVTRYNADSDVTLYVIRYNAVITAL